MVNMKKSIITIGIIVTMGSIALLYNNKKEVLLNKEDITNNKSIAIYVKQEDGNYEKTNTIPENGYMLNEDRSVCSNNAKPNWNFKTNILKINNLSSNNTSCYLYFEPATEEVNTILGNITVNKYTPDFSKIATTDEGIFKTNDNDGVSYYWRGATTTNYLKFGGYCWRIIRINGDGTIRLIYDGTTCHSNGEITTDSIAVENVAYNLNYNKSEYVGWTYTEGLQRPTNNNEGTPSNAKTKLEEWYNANLKSQESKIADGKYCNDRNVVNGQSWSSSPSASFNYASYKRLYEDYMPTLNCSSNDLYTLKVGLIMADEIELSGCKNAINTSYYLYNGQNYWTISPYQWYYGSSTSLYARVFAVNSDGYFGYWNVDYTHGVRPVINLKSNVTLTGTGTINDPYEVI
jgi:hypothetical protein